MKEIELDRRNLFPLTMPVIAHPNRTIPLTHSDINDSLNNN